MARNVRAPNLETRTPQSRNGIRGEPYRPSLNRRFFHAYRRRAAGGTCLARRRQADSRYAERCIGGIAVPELREITHGLH